MENTKINVKGDMRIEQWLQMASIKSSSRDPYLRYISIFCECVKMSPTQLIEESNNDIKAGKLVNERNIINHLTRFKKCLTERDYAPKTQALAMSTVKSFFMTHDIQLPNKLGQMKKVLPLKENMTFLSKEDVKKLITNSKSLRTRAIILIMATSGMARNEILNLRIRDIVIDENNIGTVTARREKAQVDYTTFISPEATKALKDYLDERNRTKGLQVKSDKDYIFVTYGSNGIGGIGQKLGGRSFIRNFRNLGEELDYHHDNKKGQFIKTRSHALRKFFSKTLENAKMPREKIDYLIGHTNTGNNLSYFQADITELKKLYIEFLPHLTFEHDVKVLSLNSDDAKELNLMKTENNTLKAEMDKLKKTNEDRMTAMEEIINQLVGKINTERQYRYEKIGAKEYEKEIDDIVNKYEEQTDTDTEKTVNKSIGHMDR